MRTELERAESARNEFKRSVQEGRPWLPGEAFLNNPGLDLYVQAALEGWVHAKRVAEQSQPAKRVSLTESPTVPIVPGMREWRGLGLDGKDADQEQA